MSETQERPSTLERILEAASRVFARQGYLGTSVAEVAAEAGLTKPTIYNHFENKAALYGEMLRYVHDRAEAELTLAVADVEPFSEKLKTLVKTLVEFSRRYADLIRVVHSVQSLPEGDGPQVDRKKLMDPQRSGLFRLLQEGVDRGELACDPFDLAIVIHGAVGTIALVQRMHPEIGARWAGIEDRIFEIIYRGAKRQP
jgi:AcrR family transcriptional regulator